MKRETTSVETTALPAKKTKTGKSYRCTVCSQLFHELEIVEKHCLDRHGSKKKFKTITKRNKVHRAKKSTNETKKDEKADETKVYDCAYCKFQDRTKNGLKCHLSSNVHSAQDLYDRTLRSHEELKKSLPYKCLVCHARFIELNRLKAHIETHDKTELLDRCLDFSESLRKYEEPAEPKYEEPDLNAMASNMPSEVIVTDSDSMSDEDSDEHVSAMIDVPEPDSDYLIIEPVEPYERGTSIFNPLPPFKQPEVSPGVKCYICEAILEDDADRRKHLTVDHKIAKNHHLLSFRSRQMHREMELLDMVSNLKETVARPLTTKTKERKRKSGRACADCGRLFDNAHQLIEHQLLHELP